MMAVTGDTLTMPDGTSFTIVESAADSGGARVEFEITMAPGAMGPPKHFHPRQDESWTVLEGELSVFVDDGWRTLGAGESLSIPPNTVHTLRNRSSGVVRFRDVHEPALDFQEYIEELDAQAAAGKITSSMSASTLIHGAMILRAHRTTQLSASSVQRLGETVLSLVGRALGYRVNKAPEAAERRSEDRGTP
jgi:mannose-6-phosphate isomerase-like protein (cupin superfamily)